MKIWAFEVVWIGIVVDVVLEERVALTRQEV